MTWQQRMSSIYRKRAVGLILALILVGSLSAQPTLRADEAIPSRWRVTTVVSSGDQGTCTSLALGADGHPHISYLNATDGSVQYAVRDGSAWNITTLDALTFFVESATSLALDGAGHPHVVYPYANPCSLNYLHWDGSQWISAKFTVGCTGLGTIALDDGDRVNIGYYKWTTSGGALWLMSQEGAEWARRQVEVIDLGLMNSLAKYHGLAVGADGTVHLSYYLETAHALRHATDRDGSWVKSTVDATGDVGAFSSLAVDGHGHPHISYYDIDNGDLKYAHWDGDQWQIQTVDAVGVVGQYTSLALDALDRPHIAYYDETNADLKFARWDGSEWQIETVDAEGAVGQYASLALDADGQAHISYYDATHADLKYATNAAPEQSFLYLSMLAR